MRTIFHFTLLLSVVLASALQTLNSDKDLKRTGFGRPPPRHGLRLLKWYVKTCLDNNMKARCDPIKGEYGFHKFMNKENLLPKLKKTKICGYFTIGNLKSPHAQDLPDNVKKDYNRTNPLSNTDRLLVNYNKKDQRITDIFVSQHYKKEKTYIISSKLITILRQQPPHFYIEM